MDIQTIKDVTIDYSKLVEARKTLGLSQADVGRELGFDRRQIWQFENGVGLTLANFTKLALFYKRPIEFFLANPSKIC